MNKTQELIYLFQRYKEDDCTPAERQAFMALARQPEMEAVLKQLISEYTASVDEGATLITREPDPESAEAIFQHIIAFPAGAEGIDAGKKGADAGAEAHRRWRWRLVAAACTLFLLAGVGYLIAHRQAPAPPVALRQPLKPLPQHDVLPGGNKATLTLSNGSVIVLDSAADGTLAEQGSATISKLKTGQLTYIAAGKDPATPLYNTLTTPRGGQYQLTLPDGTRVWLNAASSITYPTCFTGHERRIAMTGEAYFEVAKMSAQEGGDIARGTDHAPFIVVANGTEVEVLGTHFNVNAYKEEPALLTTLLEGAVKVSAHGDQRLIRPGEQAVVASSGKDIGLNKDVDLEGVVAWKNGFFQFDHNDLPTIMREIARWYDVEISYEGKVPDRKFGGEISRDLKLSEVLYGLKVSKVNFRIEGKKLVIMP